MRHGVKMAGEPVKHGRRSPGVKWMRAPGFVEGDFARQTKLAPVRVFVAYATGSDRGKLECPARTESGKTAPEALARQFDLRGDSRVVMKNRQAGAGPQHRVIAVEIANAALRVGGVNNIDLCLRQISQHHIAVERASRRRASGVECGAACLVITIEN